MPRYILDLINTSPNLDLRLKQVEINSVSSEISAGGKTNIAFKGVSITIVNISKNQIIIDVIEVDTHWHVEFGKKLTNDHGMRIFCDLNDPSKLFKWS